MRAARSAGMITGHRRTYKDSEDPRDRLVSMFTGEAMPGVRDGFCRIERYSDDDVLMITPVSPLDMVKCIPQIAAFAELNPAIENSGIREHYVEILKSELARVMATPDKPASSILANLERLLYPVLPSPADKDLS